MLKKIGQIFSIVREKTPKFDDDDIGFMPNRILKGNNDTDLFRTQPWQDSIQLWMKTIPESKRPLELATRHPRIIAKIMMLWTEPTTLETYLQTLLFDKRETRQGFTKSIGRELLHLQNFVMRRRKIQPPASEPTFDLSSGVPDVWRHVRAKESGRAKEFPALL